MNATSGRQGRRLDQSIRDFRARSGLTQQQAADLAGMSVAWLRDLEQGRVARPRLATLRRLALALGLTHEETADLELLVQQSETPGYDLWLRVLGPLSVRVDDRDVDLGSVRQRLLLGMLALSPNAPVSRDELMEVVWEGKPPPTAVELLQTNVSRLRRRLASRQGDAQAGRVLTATQLGYQLTVTHQQLDVLRFRQLAEEGKLAWQRGDLAGACAALGQAAELWDGDPLGDLPVLHVHPAAVALGAERNSVVLDYAKVSAEAGRHGDAVAALREVVESDPLHEAAHAALMIALAGSGQQAAALSVFSELRRHLADELGVVPGAELAEAHQRVLRQEVDRPAPVGTVTRAHRQLPRDIAEFTGRAAELRTLHGNLTGAGEAGTATAITSIVGMAGVGKTRLAVRLAHRLLSEGKYGDQQLYVDLNGHADQPAADPATVLASFLHLLGVSGDQIPAETDARAALYRDRLHDKKVLVLLDNAASEDQVLPLLPAGPTHLVLVTSRRALALDGAQLLPLDVLTPADGRSLLARVIGERRVAGEEAAAHKVIDLCGRLPLAVALMAHRLQARPTWSIGDLASRLRAAEDRTSELAAGTRRVRAAFDLSYLALSPESQRVFRLLGLHPGDDFTAWSVAALAGVAHAVAQRVLDHLADENLVSAVAGDRYRLHDLLRDYARDLVAQDAPEHRGEAISRLLEWCLHASAAARRVLVRSDEVPLDGIPAPAAVPSFDGTDATLFWLETEHATLVAAIDVAIEHELWGVAWRQSLVLRAYLERRSDWTIWIAIAHKGLLAARNDGDRFGEAWALSDLGIAYGQRGNPDESVGHLRQSLEISRELDDPDCLLRSLNNLGAAVAMRGDLQASIGLLREAREIDLTRGNGFLGARVLNNLGHVHELLGEYTEALGFFGQALERMNEIDDPRNCASTLHSFGESLIKLGRFDDAERALNQALDIDRRHRSRSGQAENLEALGDLYREIGRIPRALECYREAIVILEDLRHPHVEDVRKVLDAAERELGADAAPA
ncbi:BTAD domain-containing putative transcriptional regulator [Prauserella cavernicola]|uniref:Tetratricopeptide repeat protein n=1 Tax=Prauserella cavernicola TaxID=2800127 RepID=A0A934QMT2_9PSEU|nr:BTAD domain-containing putative transcriptional regulator [Prauserella cavernicola]MBK1783456.1 tetratricopeptide repeat protein [Prauserella cavernicola]